MYIRFKTTYEMAFGCQKCWSHKCFCNCGLHHLFTIIYPVYFQPTCPFISSPPATHLAGCSSVNVICHASVKHTLISMALWVELDPFCYSWLCHPSCLWSISYDALVIEALVSLFENPCAFAPSRGSMNRQKRNKQGLMPRYFQSLQRESKNSREGRHW